MSGQPVMPTDAISLKEEMLMAKILEEEKNKFQRLKEQFDKESGEEDAKLTLNDSSSIASTVKPKKPEPSPATILRRELEKKLNALYIDCTTLLNGKIEVPRLLSKVLRAATIISGAIPILGGMPQTVLDISARASESADKKNAAEKANGFLAILGNRIADGSRFCDFAHVMANTLTKQYAAEFLQEQESPSRFKRTVGAATGDVMKKEASKFADQLVTQVFSAVVDKEMQSFLEDEETRSAGGICNEDISDHIVDSISTEISKQRGKQSTMTKLSDLLKKGNSKDFNAIASEQDAKLKEDEEVMIRGNAYRPKRALDYAVKAATTPSRY